MRLLQSVHSGLFFATCQPNIQIRGGEIVENQSALGATFRFDAFCRPGS
jgi:hypothetical protein